jgi:hypothetical protein
VYAALLLVLDNVQGLGQHAHLGGDSSAERPQTSRLLFMQLLTTICGQSFAAFYRGRRAVLLVETDCHKPTTWHVEHSRALHSGTCAPAYCSQSLLHTFTVISLSQCDEDGSRVHPSQHLLVLQNSCSRHKEAFIDNSRVIQAFHSSSSRLGSSSLSEVSSQPWQRPCS